jgi:hypothetical protein
MADRTNFYKYRSLSGECRARTLSIITTRQIYLSNPKTFNDPFDCRPIYSLESTDEEFATYTLSVLNTLGKDVSPADRAQIIENFQRKETKEELLLDFITHHDKNVTDVYGVCSLSETAENILMWSHYADHYRGICFQFNASRFRPFFGRAQKVIYQSQRPVCNRVRQTPLEMFEKTLLTKATEWSYEKEWRILDHERGAGLQEIPAEDIESVILGCHITEKDAEEVSALVRHHLPEAKVFRAKLHESEFKVRIVQHV